MRLIESRDYHFLRQLSLFSPHYYISLYTKILEGMNFQLCIFSLWPSKFLQNQVRAICFERRMVYLASLPPLVPGAHMTKSRRKARSLDWVLNGRLPSKAWWMVGGWARANPRHSRLAWLLKIWCERKGIKHELNQT